MRNNFDQRLKRIEQTAKLKLAEQPLIIVSFVMPGQADQQREWKRAELDAQSWERRPEESSQDFERRVITHMRTQLHSPTYVLFF
jgi:hypothetical protein